MDWQYMMYDLIYNTRKKEWQILEVTDTSGFNHSLNRKFTYYYENNKWAKKSGNKLPPELIFDNFILKGAGA